VRQSANNRPVAPEGYFGASGRQGVDRGGAVQSDGSQGKSGVAGFLWAAAGALCSCLDPGASCILMAYGFTTVIRTHGWATAALATVACALVALAAGWLAAGSLVMLSVVATACSLAVSVLATRHVRSASAWIALVLVAAAAIAGIDAVASALMGMTLPELVTQVIEQYAQVLTSTGDISTRQLIPTLKSLLQTYWPASYVAQSAWFAVCSGIGVWAARRHARRVAPQAEDAVLAVAGQVPEPQGVAATFAAPLWVDVAFVCAAGARIAADLVSGTPELLGMAGANVFLVARVILTLQGLSVLWWFLSQRGHGKAVRVLAVVVGALVETSYLVISVVGLVDAVADFRQLGVGLRRARTTR